MTCNIPMCNESATKKYKGMKICKQHYEDYMDEDYIFTN